MLEAEVQKCLIGADLILKGERTGVTAQELESAAIALADARREPGEDSAVAFTRLIDKRDPDVSRLMAAMDLRRVAERHAHLFSKASTYKRAEAMVEKAQATLDLYVQTAKQPHETIEGAFLRLSRGDPRFGELYSSLHEARRLL